ncbi:mini-circle protein [Streptomyces sp. ICBB 8177]|nr:DinB family protein [Streptomyces sp. ICBB 8177]PWI46116.1 mini-circle protein [Streptomyces sp. ICBB 8177]
MTTSDPWPRPDLRPPGLNADEKTTLLTFLDYLRDSVLAKVDGVPEPAVRKAGVPSGTSLLQLLKHLTAVELNWFVWAYAGADRERWEDEEAVSADDTASGLADAYREAIAQANEVALACTDLDRPGARSLRETPPPSMRWVLVHMIEETARHAGHADILREQIDGSVGR